MTSLPTWLRRTRLSGRQARARGYRGPLLIATALIGSLAFAAPAAAAAGEESILNSISCTSTSFCIAVGSFGGGVVDQGTLAEEWNGSTWSILPTPDLGSPSRLSDVSCTASDACTAVGSGPDSPLAEVWDGSTWSIQSTPDPGASSGFGGVSCTSAGFCMAVGTSESLPMAEEWNGAAWSIETVPVPSGTKLASLGKVSCVTETSCMAVGLDIRNGTLAEYWNGSSWNVEATVNPKKAKFAYLNDVSCIALDSCLAVGMGFSETWDGSTWTLEYTPKTHERNSGLGGVSCLPPPAAVTCIGVGSSEETSGRVVTLAEAWDGDTWSILSTPNPMHTLNLLGRVSCPQAASCVATGYQQTEPHPAQALTEVWNGSAWNIEKAAPVEPVLVDPSSGLPHEAVAISGFGFPPSSMVTVTYRTRVSSPARVTLCTAVAQSDGSFSCSAAVPSKKTAGPDGEHTVTAKGSSLSWTTTFNLK